MLEFVGLGLYDERDVTLKGRDAIRAADRVYAEFYTSKLTGCTVEEIEDEHDVDIRVLDRDEVEDSDEVVDAAEDSHVVFLTAGDTMVSTTHGELRVRAEEQGVSTSLVHAPSASSAAAGATGLQNYRFGRSTSIVDREGWTPPSPLKVVLENLETDLHTLIYLDIEVGEDEGREGDGSYMSAGEGAEKLLEMEEAVESEEEVEFLVGVARLGSGDPYIFGGRPEDVVDHDFGDPLHLLVAPAELHEVERRYLKTMGNVNFEAVENKR